MQYTGDHASIPTLVIRHIRAWPGRVALQTLLSLGLAALAVLPAVIVARMVDDAIGARLDIRAALTAAAGIAALAAADAALTLARRRLGIATELAVRDAAAQQHFRDSVRLPMRAYGGGNEAAIIRSFDDLDRVIEFVAARSIELLAESLIILSAVALMLWTEWQLALVFIALTVLSLATAARSLEQVRQAIDAWLPARDRRFGFVVECITSMLTIKTLSAHRLVETPFAREQAEEQDRLRAMRDRIAVADSTSRFWNVAAPGIGTICGAIMLIGGALTAGELLLFLSVSAGLTGSLSSLHTHLRELQECRAGLDRIRSLGLGDPELLEDAAPDGMPALPVRATGLGFRHAGATADVLDEVSLSIAAGEHVAIVGRSGGGKTTLAHLLARLLEPSRGTAGLGGEPLTLDAHRRALVLAPHETTVFNASLRENVRLWDNAVDDPAVLTALDQAGLRDTVQAWAGLLETPLGAGGNPLSAGQRQRLGLARVFLRQPSVLILDEATSAMDQRTEREVLAQLRASMRGRALIVITHREAVAATFDRVIRVEGGGIV